MLPRRLSNALDRPSLQTSEPVDRFRFAAVPSSAVICPSFRFPLPAAATARWWGTTADRAAGVPRSARTDDELTSISVTATRGYREACRPALSANGRAAVGRARLGDRPGHRSGDRPGDGRSHRTGHRTAGAAVA